VEVEARGQFERIITKLECNIVQSFPCSNRYILLAETAKMHVW